MTERGRARDAPTGAPWAVLAVALLWVALLVVLQLEIGGRLVVVPWLALAPLTASLLLPWVLTSAPAVASVAAVAVLSADTGDLAGTQGRVRVLGSAALAGFGVVGAAVRVRREERVRRVAEVAAVAQATILHPVPVQVGGLLLASRYVSASSDALVGGDLYDVVAHGGGIRLVVGDARGKGLAAVQTAAAVLSAFRHAAPRAGGLDDVAREVEQALLPDLRDEDFVTAVLAELHPDGRVDLVLCGHPPPLRLVRGRPPEPVGTHPGPPLGMGVVPRVETTTLAAGERLLFYTDGLVEARDRHGRFFDLVVAAESCRPGAAPSPELLDRCLAGLLEQVRAHVGGRLDDDVAVLLVEPRPDAP